ncbi:DUF397 domain-containing protein [Streptomyces halobius]|uniref:DUF397 domain-containing protein n=1 Tax=Streptomyces halobius TaxID=2879846 RepID=A0ABY4M9R5_9ACTN|nr:DUF397 domain-containing protein [Streptomyces halobius]UQA93883.1 DUF397 domain-containing protein [Streptomyces halobius]
MSELSWQKSSFSGSNGNGECVEVTTPANGPVHYRESDQPETIALATGPTWAHFLAHIKHNPTHP